MLKSTINASNKSIQNWQKGGVAIIVALSLPVLIGMAGLALDLGKLYVTKTELQNAADACALAAAVELDGTASQFAIAENRGIAVGKFNKSFFQSAPVAFAADDSVKFSTTLNGSYLTKSAAIGAGAPANYKFVQCSVKRDEIPNYLMPVLNVLGSKVASNSNVAAAAVASNRPGQSTCALPIGICSTQINASTPVGTWLEGIQKVQGGASNGETFSGYFKWIDFSGDGGGNRELKDVLTGARDCNINSSNPNLQVGEFGLKSGAESSYNTKFGLYAQGATTGIPDVSGYAYNKTTFSKAFNAYSDYLTNAFPKNLAYQGDNITKLNTKPGLKTTLTPSELKAQGEEKRVAVAPIIDCNTKIVQKYICLFLLHPMNTGNVKKGDDEKMYLEYLGDAKNAGPCNQIGLAGASNGIGPRVSALVK